MASSTGLVMSIGDFAAGANMKQIKATVVWILRYLTAENLCRSDYGAFDRGGDDDPQALLVLKRQIPSYDCSSQVLYTHTGLQCRQQAATLTTHQLTSPAPLP